MVHKNWTLEKDFKSEGLKQWAEGHNINEFVARLAANRVGYDEQTLERYFNPSISQLRDPYLLHDMDKTVKRIKKAIAHHEKITVYGDYDADGITSTSIMVSAIKAIGGNVEAYLPSRFKEGYGPDPIAWQKIADGGTSLLITVDNGILIDDASLKVVNDNHMDLIITDHHEFADFIPKVYAIVHAQYPGAEYPFDDFCGAGIAFKISCALLGHLDHDLMAMAAIGTIADIVTLQDENRIIVTYGLHQLSKSERPGIKAMLNNLGLSGKPINSENIGFKLAPQLNALGRLGTADLGFELLTTNDDETARQLAEKTSTENDKRKAIGEKILAEADAMAEHQIANGHSTIVVAHDGWHQGVVGIVASNLVDKYNCPTIVLGRNIYVKEADVYTGSGRSIEGFDIVGALDDYRDHLISMGGHPGACGMGLHENELSGMHQHFDEKFNTYRGSHDTTPTIETAGIISVNNINNDMIEDMNNHLAPYGHGNEQPNFAICRFRVKNMLAIGKKKQYLKLYITDSVKNINTDIAVVDFDNNSIDNKEPITEGLNMHGRLKLLGTLSINEYNGKKSPQVMLKDWHLELPRNK